MPYNTGTTAFGKPTIYDSADFHKQFHLALEKFDYYELQKQCEADRRAGRAIGIGFGCFVEKVRPRPLGICAGRDRSERRGRCLYRRGRSWPGRRNGVVASRRRCAPDRYRARACRARRYRPNTFWRRQLCQPRHGARRAIRRSSQSVEVRKKLLQLAAVALQAEEKDLSIEKTLRREEGHRRKRSVRRSCQACRPQSSALPLGIKPGISGEGFFSAEHMVYPYGVHMALVEVDQETGFLKIHKYQIAYDIGRAINPMLVEGQFVGGMAQGLGGALLEEFAYDFEGQLLTGSFMDYLLPSSMEVPPVEIVLTEDAPSPLNPLGVKGVGEGGTVGVGAALANAVCNALGGKVEIKRLPLTPECVRDAVKSARAAAGRMLIGQAAAQKSQVQCR